MKKSLLGIILMQVMVCTGFAQTEEQPKRSSLSFGYGIVTSIDAIESFEDILVAPIGTTFQNEGGSGALIANFKTGNSKKFKIGGEFAFQALHKDAYSSGQKIGEYKTKYITVAPRFDYFWTTGALRLYSGAGLGLTFANQEFNGDSDSQVFVNFHLNLLGLETAGPIGVYIEGGFGYDGILNGGIRFRF